MNQRLEKDRLLRDIFSEPGDLIFRDQTHQNALKKLRRKRFHRRLWKVTGLVAAGLAVIFLGQHWFRTEPSGIEIVHSKKATIPMMATDAPGNVQLEVVVTEDLPLIDYVDEPDHLLSLSVIKTPSQAFLPVLSDADLFGAFDDQACLLAQGDDGEATLYVFSAENQTWENREELFHERSN